MSDTGNVVGTRASGECFHSFHGVSQSFTSVFISPKEHEKHCDVKKEKKSEKNLLFLNIKIKTLFACDIITSTAHASCVFFSSCNIKLLAFYHECSSLIDFATIYSEIDSG